MIETNINKQHIIVEGVPYNKSDILCSRPAFADKSPFHEETYLFLKDWFGSSDIIKLHTSGSTGTPKEITATKKQMMQSAKLTCLFLNLKAGDKTLLCMTLNSIAGRMIVVRGLVAGLDLYPVTPSGNPLKNIDIPFSFAAMVPLQVFNSLQNPVEKDRLKAIDNLIIGGGAIDNELEKELNTFPNNVYSTYGMTETLSHIALRRLNGKEASSDYKPFACVRLSLSEDNCLIIDAPLVCKETLHTNDIAQISADGSFRIIGRKDNVINSGGVKIQIEEVEEKLKPLIKDRKSVV